MRIRAAVGSVLVGAVLALLTVGPALAEEPVDLGSSPVLDLPGVLEDPAAAEAAIDGTFARTGVSLFVVLVDEFERPADAEAWIGVVAERNGLGDDDVLLAIATEGRTFSLSATEEALDDAQFDAVLDRVESALRDEDWDAAVVGAAEEIAEQLDPPFNPVPLAIGGGVVLIGGLAAAGIALARRRRTSAVARASEKELETRAGALLVQLDDAVKTSEQELGFAVAQFGEEAAAPFAAALTHAKAQLGEAFSIRSRLDDVEPETPEERRALTLRIIELCEAADATLDAHGDAFDELRQLETTAPQLVESLASEHAGLATRISSADATVAELGRRFGTPAIDAIDENPAQARTLATFVTESLATARAAIDRGDAGHAAVAVRGAQHAIQQIGQLLDAVDRLAAELPELDARLNAAVADTRSDVAEARAADPTALAPAIAEAERVLAASEQQDPATALAAVEHANAILGRELSAVRDRHAQVARAAAQLDRVTAEARLAVDSARDYIATRRGAVGSSARTRFAEAETLLAHAVSVGAVDPLAAYDAAERAARLAGSALSLARSDVSAFDRPRYDAGPDEFFDGDGGAVLGGILDALLSGSGSSSGSSWTWGGGGSRRRSSGGFGGFGGSSRRSSGGFRSSGGGRRSRGGRF